MKILSRIIEKNNTSLKYNRSLQFQWNWFGEDIWKIFDVMQNLKNDSFFTIRGRVSLFVKQGRKTWWATPFSIKILKVQYIFVSNFCNCETLYLKLALIKIWNFIYHKYGQNWAVVRIMYDQNISKIFKTVFKLTQ